MGAGGQQLHTGAMRPRSGILAITLATLGMPVAEACSCVSSGPVCQEAGAADAVFLGTVIGIDSSNAFSRRVSIRVNEGFLGFSESEIVLHTGARSGDCGYIFEVGKTYLVYALRMDDARAYATSICSRTAPANAAAEDLKYLRTVAAGGARSRVFGQAITPGREHRSKMMPSAPIAGATIELRVGERRWMAVTGPDGKYEIANWMPGEYRMSTDLGAFAAARFPRNIVLKNGGCREEILVATGKGRITGRLLDHEGNPVASQWVELRVLGETQAPMRQGGQTGDDGTFSHMQLFDGSYALGFHLYVPPAQRYLARRTLPIPRTYYPGVPDQSLAQVINIVNGHPVDGIEFRLGPPSKQRIIRGTVVSRDGNPVAGAVVRLQDPSYASREIDWFPATPSDGSFTVSGVEGQRYIITARRPDGSAEEHVHAVEVDSEDMRLVINGSGTYERCAACKRTRRSLGSTEPE